MRALAVALAVAGCGPSLIWTGHTLDRRSRVDVIEDGDLQYVTVDGHRRGAYRSIAGWSIALSEGGHLAFAARIGAGWAVVHDGRTGQAWDSIGELVLAPSGRLAYSAERAGGWYVVTDDHVGPRFDAILAGTLAFDRDGKRVAYVAESDHRVRAIVDGVPGPVFDGIGQLAFTGDGTRFAYAGRTGLDAFAVVDGVVGPRWAGVAKVTVSPTGNHVAYAALAGNQWRVVVDGEAGPAVDRVKRIVFDSDGGHVAWVGRIAETDVIALDGTPVAGASQLREGSVSFRPHTGPTPGLAYTIPDETAGEHVVFDDQRSSTYDEVGAPIWSADGRVAFRARRGGSWMIVVGDRELAAASYVSDPVFGPNGRVGYVARRGKISYVVVDGCEHPFDLVFEDTLTFSADGRRWAVLAGSLARERMFFVIEGRPDLALSPLEIYSAGARDRSANPLRAWTQAEADR